MTYEEKLNNTALNHATYVLFGNMQSIDHKEMQDSFIAGAKFGAENWNWIEGAPKNDDYYLFRITNGEIFDFIYGYVDERNYLSDLSGDLYVEAGVITHHIKISEPK